MSPSPRGILGRIPIYFSLPRNFLWVTVIPYLSTRRTIAHLSVDS